MFLKIHKTFKSGFNVCGFVFSPSFGKQIFVYCLGILDCVCAYQA